MSKKLSTAEKVRRMIDQGHTNKAIIEKLGIKPQAVYNIRYQINKARGLGAIGTPTPVPVEGIGAPPKKRTRKVRAGTGITLPEVDVAPIRPVGQPGNRDSDQHVEHCEAEAIEQAHGGVADLEVFLHGLHQKSQRLPVDKGQRIGKCKRTCTMATIAPPKSSSSRPTRSSIAFSASPPTR